MADYWMKLYIEILDDPKMATLPDRIWRRIIELFLIAKRLGKDGHLPDTRQLAWMLRMSADELEGDMAQVAQTQIVIREVGGWFIPKFSQRQSAVSDAERKSQERKRKQSQQYYGNVTDESRNVTQSTEYRLTENREQNTETEQIPPRPLVFTLYEREIGALSPLIADKLILAEKEYPVEWIEDALHEAVIHNARSWKYAETILKRWKVEGRKDKAKSNGSSGTRPTEPVMITLSDGTQVEAKP